MGNQLSLWQPKPPRECKILFWGLDAAGKTTVLYKLGHPKNNIIYSIPTIGFNVEKLSVRGFEFTAWDVGGRSKLRSLWRLYYPEADAILWIVDSNDQDRLEQVRDELRRTLLEDELGSVPLLILCNKQDLPNAMSPQEVGEKIWVPELIGNRKWTVMGCTATTGKGLPEALEWISQALIEPEEEKKNLKEEEETIPSTACSDAFEETVLDFDPTMVGKLTLERFAPIQRGTECPFAKAVNLWGGMSLSTDTMLIEAQAMAHAPMLTEFARQSKSGKNLDGFCIELPHEENGGTKELGESVRQMLTALSDSDPNGESVMRVNYIGARGWRFRFAGADFFVTTFAPCYPKTSSRYAFGTGRAFLLLQPEDSFARHDLPPMDSKETTIRDKTHSAFQKAGRGYHKSKPKESPAEHIVKPIDDNGVNVIRWWLPF